MSKPPPDSLPFLYRYENDNASSILDDQRNTFIQAGGAYFPDLRTFVAKPGMIVMVSGGYTFDDGLQGFFQYFTGSAVDDNINILVVNSSLTWPPAYWKRVLIAGGVFGAIYDIAMNYGAVPPPPNTTFLSFVTLRGYTLPLNLLGTVGVFDTGPSVSLTLSILKNGSQFGTATFPTGSPSTASFSSTPANFAVGDRLQVSVGSANFGATDLAITFLGTRTS